MQPPSTRRPLTGALPSLAIAAALSLLLALPASAAFSPPQVLRAAHDQLAAAVLASDRGDVVAGWLEPDMTLDLRISLDGGHSFGRRVAMGHTLSASLALCGGVIVVERWDGTAIKLDLRSLDGHLATTRTIATGPRFTFQAGVACVGTRRAIVEWSVWHNGAWHLRTELVPLFEPLPSVVYDLGTVLVTRLFLWQPPIDRPGSYGSKATTCASGASTSPTMIRPPSPRTMVMSLPRWPAA